MDYESVVNSYKKIEEDILLDIEKTSIPKTLKSLTRASKKIDEILESLILIKDHFYCSQILVRSLFEHFIVAHYIYIQWYKNRNDKVGSEYYMEYVGSEFLKQTSYNYQIDGIEQKTNDKITLDEYRKINGMEEATQADIQDLHKIGNQFEIKNIGKFLMSLNIDSESLRGIHRGMLDFMRRYNKLSSWVHGGPTAEISSFDLELNKNNEISEENIGWAKSASRSIKSNIVGIMSFEFKDKYLKSFEAMIKKAPN